MAEQVQPALTSASASAASASAPVAPDGAGFEAFSPEVASILRNPLRKARDGLVFSSVAAQDPQSDGSERTRGGGQETAALFAVRHLVFKLARWLDPSANENALTAKWGQVKAKLARARTKDPGTFDALYIRATSAQRAALHGGEAIVARGQGPILARGATLLADAHDWFAKADEKQLVEQVQCAVRCMQCRMPVHNFRHPRKQETHTHVQTH